MKMTLLASILIGLTLSTATPTFAAEKVQFVAEPAAAPRVLKFKTTETGDIEDAIGSNLIKRFRESLTSEVEIWKLKQSKCLEILKTQEEKLRDKDLSNSERYVIETDVAYLKGKVSILEDKILECTLKCTEKEVFLRETLREIPSTEASQSIPCMVANWEFFNTAHVRFLESVKLPSNPFDSNNMQITFQLRSPSTINNFHNRANKIFDPHLTSQIHQIHESIQKLTRLFRTSPEISTSFNFHKVAKYATLQKIAQQSKKSVPDLIMAEIERLERKAHTVIIPLLAPAYWMAQVLIAYQNEVQFHHPKIVAQATTDAPVDNQ